jgi:hypothetical protein
LGNSLSRQPGDFTHQLGGHAFPEHVGGGLLPAFQQTSLFALLLPEQVEASSLMSMLRAIFCAALNTVVPKFLNTAKQTSCMVRCANSNWPRASSLKLHLLVFA